MSAPYYSDFDVTLHLGDAAAVMHSLPAGGAQCVVTSPPYYGLRDYGVDGQIGLEPSPAEYVAALVDVFRGVRHVLADDGVAWLNLGDSYSRGEGTHTDGPQQSRNGSGVRGPRLMHPSAGHAGATRTFAEVPPPKNLLGIPWRVAFALQDDGWILRNAVIWNKPNAMPESVTDRLSTRYETVFLLAKSRRYQFDLDPIREPLAYPDAADGSRIFGGKNKAEHHRSGPGSSTRRTGNVYGKAAGTNLAPTGSQHTATDPRGRNPGDVWTIATSPFPGAHFATMSPALVRRCILAGSREGDTILDPFNGSGTTGMVARQLGRRYVGIDLNSEYLDLAVKRIGDTPLDFGATA